MKTQTHKTTQLLSSLIVLLLLLASCGSECKNFEDIPVNPKLKASVQGVFGHHYWLLINDYGDTLEIQCEDFNNAMSDLYSIKECENWEFIT